MKHLRLEKAAVTEEDKHHYSMDSDATIKQIMEQYSSDNAAAFIKSRIDAGTDSHVRLVGMDKKFYLTGSETTGQFVTAEHPGMTATERRENLQLPPTNDGKEVYLVQTKRPTVMIESTVAPMKEWAKTVGYKERAGMQQFFTPPRFSEEKVPTAKEAFSESPFDVVRKINGRKQHVSERKDQEDTAEKNNMKNEDKKQGETE